MKLEENKWAKFYTKTFSLTQYLKTLSIHAPLFEAIVKEKAKRILEVGTGSGSMSIFLSHLGYDVVSVDNNKTIIELARRLNNKLNGAVTFILCDAFYIDNVFKSGSFDLCFSQGFFEHFSDEEIKILLKKQLNVSHIVIFSVPSKYYPRRSIGDERLLSAADWSRILRDDFKIDFITYYVAVNQIGLRGFLKNLLKDLKPPLLKPNHLLIKVTT